MKSIHDINLENVSKQNDHFSSPEAWEDQILYFLMTDRFSNGNEKNLYNPEADFDSALKNDETQQAWQEKGGTWNGGTIKGLHSKLDYLHQLGVTAIWVSPIFKQVAFQESYHGYGIQNFLDVDPHYGSREDLKELAKAAHEKGMYIILDIILNHTGDVFAYEENAPQYRNEPYPMKAFRDKTGEPSIPVTGFDPDTAWPDGGIWPIELMNPDTFTRKGAINNWDAFPEYIEGDFLSLKNIHTGHYEGDHFHVSDALRIITDCFKYWIAYADIDGFRLDTVKHLNTEATRYFVREIHEFAKTIGKNNFYIIGEITGGFEFAIDTLKKTGLDAALGINKVPEKLENVAKGYLDPDEFFNLFKNSELLGDDEYKWYRDNVVTMFDDHDMVTHGGDKSRFCADQPTAPLLPNALFLNIMSPGIPCIYYGTEQAFDGSGGGDQYVREAMFEGAFGAFRTTDRHFFNSETPAYKAFAEMARLRKEHLTLRQGRLYQREISYDGNHFARPHKLGEGRHTGVIAWSRILSSDEIVLAINCDTENEQQVSILIDPSLHKPGENFVCIYSSNEAQHQTTIPVQEQDGRMTLQVTVPPAGSIALRK